LSLRHVQTAAQILCPRCGQWSVLPAKAGSLSLAYRQPTA
jgi:hypothetical protein